MHQKDKRLRDRSLRNAERYGRDEGSTRNYGPETAEGTRNVIGDGCKSYIAFMLESKASKSQVVVITILVQFSAFKLTKV